ncbi:unnamed protein product [Coffea canephora]|uniref:Beta-glucosidase 18-like n=1 Tax=Coffea canephora TaxID=49390 RepID=A0A068UAE5_COFCA|nr:unnamed protein product [Coffea canephora]
MLASSSFLLFILLISANPCVRAYNQGGNGIAEEFEDVKRSDFPAGFLFGASTSSYQIEGAILEDGKSFSDWDVFVRKIGNIKNGDTGDIATDHYHRYMEDIEIIHSLGMDAYRFSISWPRILPNGKSGGVNAAGIMFYNSIIDNLLLRGIQPFVTIYHWDMPQVLSDKYGGWLSPLIQDDFLHFAETCFKNFGDRVRYWVTINEPNTVAEFAFERGVSPPGHCSPPFGNCSAGNSDTEPLIAMHNMLLAHAKAFKLYREQFLASQPKQGGVIGIVLHSFMFEPLTDDEHNKEAADRALAFNLAWALDPLVFGDYPPEMRRYHGNELPKFTSEERLLIRDSIDFIGLNHYSTLYAKDCIHSSCSCSGSACLPGGDRAIRGFVSTSAENGGVLIGEPTGMPRFSVVPRGMEEIVDYAVNRYNNKPIFITENGYSSPLQQDQLDDLQHDVKRIEFHQAYLASLARAMRNGADVRGYFVWTLMDNFEWSFGYDVKFGLYSVDRATLNRNPRSSAKWYRNFLRNISSNGMKPRTAFSLWSKVGRGEEE